MSSSIRSAACPAGSADRHLLLQGPLGEEGGLDLDVGIFLHVLCRQSTQLVQLGKALQMVTSVWAVPAHAVAPNPINTSATAVTRIGSMDRYAIRIGLLLFSTDDNSLLEEGRFASGAAIVSQR